MFASPFVFLTIIFYARRDTICAKSCREAPQKLFWLLFLEKSNILFSTSFQIKRGLAPPHLFLYLSVAAASDEKKRNDKKPDIIVVKNVAKAVVHK